MTHATPATASARATAIEADIGTTVETSWADIQRLTAAMRVAAGSEEWPEVVELAAKRHRSLLHHFARFPVGPDNAVFYQNNLTGMLRGEQELQAIAVDARRQVMRQSATARHGRRAVGAYLRAD